MGEEMTPNKVFGSYFNMWKHLLGHKSQKRLKLL